MKSIDITGMQFHYLRAIMRVPNKGKHQCWIFKCICGEKVTKTKFHVVGGGTKSCGCYRKKWASENIYKRMKARQ